MPIVCLRICTYQSVEGGATDEPIWEKGQGKGAQWHKEFILELPNDDPRFHTDVYEVKVRHKSRGAPYPECMKRCQRLSLPRL